MTAVAVFGARPSADTLLADRLARGWRPTPSPLVTGPTVLGHAACVSTSVLGGPHEGAPPRRGTPNQR